MQYLLSFYYYNIKTSKIIVTSCNVIFFLWKTVKKIIIYHFDISDSAMSYVGNGTKPFAIWICVSVVQFLLFCTIYTAFILYNLYIYIFVLKFSFVNFVTINFVISCFPTYVCNTHGIKNQKSKVYMNSIKHCTAVSPGPYSITLPWCYIFY